MVTSWTVRPSRCVGTCTRICATSPLPNSVSVSICRVQPSMSVKVPADHRTGETVLIPWAPEDLGAVWVVDPGHDDRHAEAPPGRERRHDVAVVARGGSDEGVRALEPRLLEDVAVVAVADDLLAREPGAQLVHGGGVAVDDRDLMALAVEHVGDAAPEPAAPEDDHAHG